MAFVGPSPTSDADTNVELHKEDIEMTPIESLNEESLTSDSEMDFEMHDGIVQIRDVALVDVEMSDLDEASESSASATASHITDNDTASDSPMEVNVPVYPDSVDFSCNRG